MRNPSVTIVAAIFLCSIGSTLALGQNAIHGQLYRDCNRKDNVCLTNWWAEYRAGLLDEFIRWRKFEREFGNGQINLKAAQMIGSVQADEDKYYRHELWFYSDLTRINGVSDSDLSAIRGVCRVAIIDMKFLVVGLAETDSFLGYKSVSSLQNDIRDYSKYARLCEKHFNISPDPQ